MTEEHIPIAQQNTRTTQPPDSALRQLLADEIRRSGLKRPEIAARMSAIVGVPVSEHMLNDFSSKRKCAARFPAAFVKAFCAVIGSRALHRLLEDEETLGLIQVGEHAVACKNLVYQIATPKANRRRRKK
jgi:hypothetical protein